MLDAELIKKDRSAVTGLFCHFNSHKIPIPYHHTEIPVKKALEKWLKNIETNKIVL
jgi:hypothetical protein